MTHPVSTRSRFHTFAPDTVSTTARPALAYALATHRDEATAAYVLLAGRPAAALGVRTEILAFAEHLAASGSHAMAAHARRVADALRPAG